MTKSMEKPRGEPIEKLEEKLEGTQSSKFEVEYEKDNQYSKKTFFSGLLLFCSTRHKSFQIEKHLYNTIFQC